MVTGKRFQRTMCVRQAWEPGQVYYVADYLVHRYFEMANGSPRWVKNPPEEPCFVIQNGDKWVRVAMQSAMNHS